MGTTIETILAFAGIMLGLSLAITVLNQLVSNLLGLRGSALKWGLVTLIENLHAKAMTASNVSTTHIDGIVDGILTDPLVTDATTPFGNLTRLWHRATALTYEEFQRTLQFTTQPVNPNAAAPQRGSLEEARTWLVQNQLVTKEWFDSAMARVSQRFAMRMRTCTILFAFALSFVLQINTLDLLHQLQSNPAAVAKINAQLEEQIPKTTLTPADSEKVLSDLRKTFDSAGIVVYGKSPEGWADYCGMLLTSILLSLGAPFWFNQLKNVATLRSVVAQKAAAEASAPSALPPIATLSVTERRV